MSTRTDRRTPTGLGPRGQSRALARVRRRLMWHEKGLHGSGSRLLAASGTRMPDAQEFIGAALQALAQFHELIGGGHSAADLPTRDTAFAHVAAISGHADSQLLLRELRCTALHGESFAEGQRGTCHAR